MVPEEKAEAVAASPTSTASPSGGGSKIVLMLTAVNILATLAMAGVLFISFQRDKKQPTVEDIATHAPASESGEGEKGKHGEAKEGEKKRGVEFGKMVSLDQFTINLSTPGSVNPKFVRVNISIEVPNDDAESEITQKMPQVRNAIIDLFNSKRPADLATAEGRDYLKEEIRNALNSFMITGKVRGVFFTNFAVSP